MLLNIIQKITVALLLHFSFWNELNGQTIDAVAQAALVLRTVRENMAQMGISNPTANFRPSHVETLVFLVSRYIWTDRTGETWPTAARVKLIL